MANIASNGDHDRAISSAPPQPRQWARISERAGDAAIFLFLLTISGLFVLAVTIATPLVVLASAITGIFTHSGGHRHWRPVAV
ncbi:MAG: hypothetical protein AAGC77_00200 [Pseudomonadota bacterium]